MDNKNQALNEQEVSDEAAGGPGVRGAVEREGDLERHGGAA